MTAPTGPGPTISTAHSGSRVARRSALSTGTARSMRICSSTNSTTASTPDGTEELDDAVIKSVDPAIVEGLEGLSEKDHEAWMKELRVQQTFRKRTIKNRVITVRRIDAKYIHQTTAWPTQWQPFIPWVHEETDYMGERDMRGTVRDAKDAQRVYNVNVSSLSEAVNDAPKNRIVGYKGQFGKPQSDTRKAWENAPNKRFAFLEVEEVTGPFPLATVPPGQHHEVGTWWPGVSIRRCLARLGRSRGRACWGRWSGRRRG